MNEWFVYILECSDNTLYCGITNNLSNRINNHNKGKGAKYTQTRRPVELKFVVGGFSRSEAAKVEYKVKQQRKENKIKFLANIKISE